MNAFPQPWAQQPTTESQRVIPATTLTAIVCLGEPAHALVVPMPLTSGDQMIVPQALLLTGTSSTPLLSRTLGTMTTNESDRLKPPG